MANRVNSIGQPVDTILRGSGNVPDQITNAPLSRGEALAKLPAQSAASGRGSETGGQSGQEKDTDKLAEALQKASETVRIFNPALHFEIHEETGRVLVQVIDMEEGKVIREIPPEKVLDMVARIQEMVGLLVDEIR